MRETEFPGVQHLPRAASCQLGRIKLIAQHGMAKMMEMDANLVGATAVDTAFHQAGFRPFAHHSVVGAGGPAPAPAPRPHALAMNRVTADGFLDHA